MPSLPLDILCHAGAHCVACRDRGDAGAAWRASALAVFAAPKGWPECPHGVPWGVASQPAGLDVPAPATAPGGRPISEAGPELWAWLHARARAVDLSTPAAVDAARDELDAFALRLPCGECRDHWLELLAAHPPDLSSNEAYYAWTVDRHNDVNLRLEKPAWKPSARI